MGLELPTSFGLAFFLRILPGFISSFPIIIVVSPYIGLDWTPLPFEQKILIVGIVGLILGIVLYSLDFFIYTRYEGRYGWPTCLKQLMITRLNNKIRRKYAEESRLSKETEDLKQKKTTSIEEQREIEALEMEWGEIWAYLLQFPMIVTGKEIQRRALAPTRFGNILLEGELYSEKKYGMDIVFFWPRMRFVVPENVWNEIDTTKALADFLVYLSFSLVIYAPIHIAGYLHQGHWQLALMGIAIPLLAYLLYRFSWSVLRTYYDYIKAVFDTYRGELGKKMPIKTRAEIMQENEEWDKKWRYLQYHEYPEEEKKNLGGDMICPKKGKARKRK